MLGVIDKILTPVLFICLSAGIIYKQRHMKTSILGLKPGLTHIGVYKFLQQISRGTKIGSQAVKGLYFRRSRGTDQLCSNRTVDAEIMALFSYYVFVKMRSSIFYLRTRN